MSKNKETANELIDLSEYSGIVTIKARPTNDNLGLAENGFTIMPNTSQSEPMICLTREDGSLRYVTGMDEEAKAIRSIEDKDRRAAKILSIRKKVAYLEKAHNGNHEPADHLEDPDFWSYVKTFRPDLGDYYSKIRLIYGNDDDYLMPSKNVKDFVIYEAIMAGGFSMIGKDLEDARSRQLKFYLSVDRRETAKDVSLMRKKNKAGRILDELYEEDTNFMFYLCKVLSPDARSLRQSQSKEVFYAQLQNFIDGKADLPVARAVEKFIECAERERDDVTIEALVRDAMFYKSIYERDKALFDRNTNTNLGRNVFEVVETLKDTTNSDISQKLFKEIKEKYWK